MDLTSPAGHAALWALGAVASGVLAVRATRMREDRGPWLAFAAAALLLSASDVAVLHLATGTGTGTGVGTGVADWWVLCLGLAAYALFYGANLHLFNQRVAAHTAGAVLDTVGGLCVAFAVGCAVLLPRVTRVPGLDGAQELLLVARPAAGILVIGFSLGTLLLSGRAREARSWLVVAAVAAAFLTDSAAVATVAAGGAPHLAAPLLAASHLAGPAALLLASLLGTPPTRDRTDEDAHVVLLGPLSYLLSAMVLMAWGHVSELPTAALVAVLAALALVGVKVVVIFVRVTALNTTRRQAMTDELTGAGNRRALTASLAQVDAGAPMALALLDLDRFKEVNDVLGHAAGDDLLRQVAQRLAADSPHGELVVRQGGDEFALVLHGASGAVAAERAALAVQRLAAPFRLGGKEVSVAVSIGVAASPEHADCAEELLRKADCAMYQAKAGGGGVLLYDREADEQRLREQEMVTELRATVAEDGLSVHFQPQLDAATGELVGVEALVRWEHPTRGMVAPADFLPIVERLGLMDAMTEQVLRKALARAAGTRAVEGRRVRTSVNISATCLLDPDLVTTVASLLLQHGIAPGDLVLEITETELMLDPQVSRRVVQELVDLGVGVSIDDYGTGHSSLAYLKDLPASELKLDRSFTAELTSDARTGDIVRTTVDLAHSLGLRLVAEGVEDEATLQRLRELGVDVTQGYHHARPLDAAGLARWVRQRRRAPAGP